MSKPKQPITYSFTEPSTKQKGSIALGAIENTPCAAIFSGPEASPVFVPFAALVAALTDACGGSKKLETFAQMLEGGEE